MILCKEEFAKEVNKKIFPGIQGGPLMHIIAAKAVCFQEAMKPEFGEYQKQVVKNAKTLAAAMQGLGFQIVSGGTDNHLLMLDFRNTHPELTGKVAQQALDKANITTNKNTVPGETRSPVSPCITYSGRPPVFEATTGLSKA